MDDEDSQISEATKNSIRAKYKYRCAICLIRLPKHGLQCVKLLDREQLLMAKELGILPEDYQLPIAENTILRKCLQAMNMALN